MRWDVVSNCVGWSPRGSRPQAKELQGIVAQPAVGNAPWRHCPVDAIRCMGYEDEWLRLRRIIMSGTAAILEWFSCTKYGMVNRRLRRENYL